MPPETVFQDRVRLFAAHKRGEDAILLARQMEIKDGTAKDGFKKSHYRWRSYRLTSWGTSQYQSNRRHEESC